MMRLCSMTPKSANMCCRLIGVYIIGAYLVPVKIFFIHAFRSIAEPHSSVSVGPTLCYGLGVI